MSPSSLLTDQCLNPMDTVARVCLCAYNAGTQRLQQYDVCLRCRDATTYGLIWDCVLAVSSERTRPECSFLLPLDRNILRAASVANLDERIENETTSSLPAAQSNVTAATQQDGQLKQVIQCRHLSASCLSKATPIHGGKLLSGTRYTLTGQSHTPRLFRTRSNHGGSSFLNNSHCLLYSKFPYQRRDIRAYHVR